jgi:outer membrane lipoprotein-sorting protein
MKTKLLCFALFAFLPLSAPAQTADDIVKKYIEARGGAEKIKAVQSERVTGHITFAAGVEGPFLIEFKRPLKLHMEATFQGHSLVRVYDGKSGWIINPFDANKGAQPMTVEDLESVSDESDFDGPLVDYKAKGNQIEFAGKDELEGKPAYKLKLTRKNGDTRTYYIDASSYLVVQWDGVTKLEGKDILFQNFLHDYRDVEGLKFPFEVDTSFPEAPQQRKFVIESVELNPPIDDARFAKPVAPPASADPPAQPPADDKPRR